MPTSTKHLGWSNRMTWLVNLHLTNDADFYECLRQEVRRILGSDPGLRTHQGLVADMLQGFVTGLADDSYEDSDGSLTDQLFADIVGTALGQVDWYEVASAWMAE